MQTAVNLHCLWMIKKQEMHELVLKLKPDMDGNFYSSKKMIMVILMPNQPFGVGCSLLWVQGSQLGHSQGTNCESHPDGEGLDLELGDAGRGQGSDTACPGVNCQAPVCSGQLSSKAESCQDAKFMGKEFQVHLLIALTWSKSIQHFADSNLELHPLLEETRLDFSAKAWCQCTHSLDTMAAPSWGSIGESGSKAFCSSSLTADAVAPAGSMSGCLNGSEKTFKKWQDYDMVWVSRFEGLKQTFVPNQLKWVIRCKELFPSWCSVLVPGCQWSILWINASSRTGSAALQSPQPLAQLGWHNPWTCPQVAPGQQSLPGHMETS